MDIAGSDSNASAAIRSDRAAVADHRAAVADHRAAVADHRAAVADRDAGAVLERDGVAGVAMETRIRVRYADTDQMGIVYNGKYLEYFEVGRTELIRACGLSYREFEEAGTRLPLVESHCRYHQPARYDDVLVVRAEVRELPRSTLHISYGIRRESDGILITTGYTTHAFLDVATLRPVRPPSMFLDAMWPDR